MPKHILEQDLKAIEHQIAVCHKGIGISELEAVLAAAGIAMNRRFLLCRISILFESSRIPEVDRQRFVNLVDTKLKGLHEWNIARVYIRGRVSTLNKIN